jgi:hypothetical protein
MKNITSFLITLYFVVVSAVALFTFMFSAGQLLDTGLKTYVFKAADVPSYIQRCDSTSIPRYQPDDQSDDEWIAECEERRERAFEDHNRQKASDAVQALALILVSLPIFLLHFHVVRKEWKRRD